MNQLVGYLACCASLSFTLVACDKGGGGKSATEKKPKAEAAEGSKPETAPEAVDKEQGGAKLAKNSFALPSKEDAQVAKAAYKVHLDAGRKAVKAKDYAAGISELSQAKTLSPASPKVLGELGWAYFLDGKHDAAEVELKLALRHVKDDKTRGAVLYNLGRVEEARENQELAADYYRQSLDRRPNETVKARLDGLGGAEESDHAACIFEKRTGPVPKDLCANLLADIEPDDPEDPPACEFDESKSRPAGAGQQTVFMVEEPGFRATVFSIYDRDMYEERFVLAVTSGESWWISDLASVSHPGVGYADESVDSVSLVAEDLISGGKKELVVTWSVSGHDMDPGIEWMEDYGDSNVAVVSMDGGAPQWMATVRTGADSSGGNMDPNEWGAMIDPEEATFVALHDFVDGKVIVEKDIAARLPESSPAGTFDLGSYPILCPAEQYYFGL